MKNVAVQEQEIARNFTVRRIETKLQGSGTCFWVPEDEVQLKRKTIKENGWYEAADDGAYGYSEVTVSGRFSPDIYVNKNVNDNGTYAAADDGAYGYYDILVDVPDPNTNPGASVEGYQDGHWVRYYIDEDGALVNVQEN